MKEFVDVEDVYYSRGIFYTSFICLIFGIYFIHSKFFVFYVADGVFVPYLNKIF